MVLKMYSTLDIKAKCYLRPFCAINDSMAHRAFGDAVIDASTPLHAHPEDYQLFSIGEFDDITGVITRKVEFICKALDFVPPRKD